MRAAAQESFLSPYEEDLKTVRRIVEIQSAGTESLKAFSRVIGVVNLKIQEIRPLFRISATAVPPEERLAAAKKVIKEGVALLADLEPLVLTFKIADAPPQVADAIQELRKPVNELRDIVDQKQEQMDLFSKRFAS